MEKKKNILAIVLGILGIIFGVMFPAASLGCSIPGLVNSVKKRKDHHFVKPMVLNIVGIVLAVANSTLAIIFTAIHFAKQDRAED